MRRHSLILMASAVALFAVGCTSGEETASNNDASPSPSPEATQSPVAAQPFEQPLVSEKGKEGDQKAGGKDATKDAKKIAKNKVPGLLQSTDPDERAKRVQAGIKGGRAGLDPFASLPPILTFKTPVPAGSTASGGPGGGFGPASGGPGGGFAPGGGQRGTLPGFRGNDGTQIATGPGNVPSIPAFPEANEIRPPRPTIAQGSGGTSRPGGGSATSVPMNPGGRPGSGENPGLKPLPPIPEPTLARAVEVTGVVTLGGLTQAIVKAPNEPTSRHVTVGQRLSNGQVLVKRIEVNAGSDPIVVFEENGVEVARAVGEKSTPAGPGGVPTAFVPPSSM